MAKFFGKFKPTIRPGEEDIPVLFESKKDALEKLRKREEQLGQKVTLRLWKYWDVAPHADMLTKKRAPNQIIRLDDKGREKRIS